jgi:hypothetical protein
MTEIEYKVSDLINFSSQQKPVDFELAFQSIMNNRLASAVDQRKIEVAQRMFGDQETTEEETNGEAA